jgi:hypothetical protein
VEEFQVATGGGVWVAAGDISEPHGFDRNELALDQGSDMDGSRNEAILKLLSRCLCRI